MQAGAIKVNNPELVQQVNLWDFCLPVLPWVPNLALCKHVGTSTKKTGDHTAWYHHQLEVLLYSLQSSSLKYG